MTAAAAAASITAALIVFSTSSRAAALIATPRSWRARPPGWRAPRRARGAGGSGARARRRRGRPAPRGARPRDRAPRRAALARQQVDRPRRGRRLAQRLQPCGEPAIGRRGPGIAGRGEVVRRQGVELHRDRIECRSRRRRWPPAHSRAQDHSPILSGASAARRRPCGRARAVQFAVQALHVLSSSAAVCAASFRLVSSSPGTCRSYL